MKLNSINRNVITNNILSTTSYDQKYKDIRIPSTEPSYTLKYLAENEKKTLGLTATTNTNNQPDKYREYLDNIMNNKPVTNTTLNNTNPPVIKTQDVQNPNEIYNNYVYETKKQYEQYPINNNQNNYPLISNTNISENTYTSNIPLKGNSQNNLYYIESKDSTHKMTSNYISPYLDSAKISPYNYTGNNVLNGQEQVKNQYDLSSENKPINYGIEFKTDYLNNKNLYSNQDNTKFQLYNLANNDSNKNLDAASKKIILDLKKEISDSLQKFTISNSNIDINSLGSRVLVILKNLNSQIDGALDLIEKEKK